MPEAPYVLLNVLSMAALAAFAWYVKARIPQLPTWLVWTWLMTLPWTLEFSAHIINPSYLLAPAIAFFIGFFEAVPAFRRGKIPVPVAFGLMGAATACGYSNPHVVAPAAALRRHSPGLPDGVSGRVH